MPKRICSGTELRMVLPGIGVAFSPMSLKKAGKERSKLLHDPEPRLLMSRLHHLPTEAIARPAHLWITIELRLWQYC
jgi:hypothetical protein